MTPEPASVPTEMRAIRLNTEGLDGLAGEQVATPEPGPGEALVRVHAAAITRDELAWPTDRLPAIPSYELSGVVVAVGPDVGERLVGEAVYALTAFDRDGVAADYAVVPTALLAPSIYFVVEPNREQLLEITKRVDAGALRPAIDEVFELPDARAAFDRSLERDTRGKVVLRVAGEQE